MHRSSVCRSYSDRRYLLSVEKTTRISTLAEEIPGPIDIRVGRSGATNSARSLSLRFSRNAAAGVYHNTAAVIDADGTLLGAYRKMHIPDDPLLSTRISDFTPGDLGFRTWKTQHGKIGVLHPPGPMVSRGGATDWHCAGHRFCFIRPRLVGILRRRKQYRAQRSMPHGKPCSAVTQSRTDAMSRRRTGSVTKRLRAAMALNFGDKAFASRPGRRDHRQSVLSTGRGL